jgi:hypothetical protein
MSFILGANYQYYLGFSALCTRISALLPGTFCSISYFFDKGFTLVELQNGERPLRLQCLAPGVWDMGHLAGFYQLEERGGCVTRCGALEACRSPVSCPVPPRSVVWGPFV